METGKIVSMLVIAVVSILIGTTVGYKIGHASGVIETQTKLVNEQIATADQAADQASSPYASVASNPIGDVQTNPFSN